MKISEIGDSEKVFSSDVTATADDRKAGDGSVRDGENSHVLSAGAVEVTSDKDGRRNEEEEEKRETIPRRDDNDAGLEVMSASAQLPDEKKVEPTTTSERADPVLSVPVKLPSLDLPENLATRSPLDIEGERQISRFMVADADEAESQEDAAEAEVLPLNPSMETVQHEPSSPLIQTRKDLSDDSKSSSSSGAKAAPAPSQPSTESSTVHGEENSPAEATEQFDTTEKTPQASVLPPNSPVRTVQAQATVTGSGKQGEKEKGPPSPSPTVSWNFQATVRFFWIISVQRASTSRESSISSVPEGELERLQHINALQSSPSETPGQLDSEGERELEEKYATTECITMSDSFFPPFL